jgi:flagellin-like hook-associated protein FlgL
MTAYDNSKATILAKFNAAADAFVASMDKTIASIRAEAATMAGNVAILEVRSNFTEEYVGVLEGGAGQLTLADLNEEGANLLALQTRQQMGIQALSFAGQSEQAVLGLFR